MLEPVEHGDPGACAGREHEAVVGERCDPSSSCTRRCAAESIATALTPVRMSTPPARSAVRVDEVEFVALHVADRVLGHHDPVVRVAPLRADHRQGDHATGDRGQQLFGEPGADGAEADEDDAERGGGVTAIRSAVLPASGAARRRRGRS